MDQTSVFVRFKKGIKPTYIRQNFGYIQILGRVNTEILQIEPILCIKDEHKCDNAYKRLLENYGKLVWPCRRSVFFHLSQFTTNFKTHLTLYILCFFFFMLVFFFLFNFYKRVKIC